MLWCKCQVLKFCSLLEFLGEAEQIMEVVSISCH